MLFMEDFQPLWMNLAKCKNDIDLQYIIHTGGKDPFFELHGVDATKFIHTYCRDCEVRNQCLGYAIEHDEPGGWGGMTHRERRNLVRRQRKDYEVLLTQMRRLSLGDKNNPIAS